MGFTSRRHRGTRRPKAQAQKQLTTGMMPYYADSATLFMVYGDSNLLERLQPDGARVICFFFPRGKPCLVCWLVSPPKWREASLPVAVLFPGPALGRFCACASGRHVLRWRHRMTPRATRYAASRHTTRQLPPCTAIFSVPNKTHQHSREGDSKIEIRSTPSA